MSREKIVCIELAGISLLEIVHLLLDICFSKSPDGAITLRESTSTEGTIVLQKRCFKGKSICC